MKKILLPLIVLVFISNAFAQLPSSYDLRTLGYITPVKDQANCGSCWAFATCASIESSWLKQFGITLDIAEDNIIDCHNFDESPCNGGSFYMSQAMLSMHKGFFTEAQDPYTPSLSNCITSYPFPPSPHAYIEEAIFLPADIAVIKQALIDYGAVATTMYMNYTDQTVWDGINYKYYDNNITSADLAYAHCVTIVGWDNSYTFPGAPGNGGWIIKDSYGTSWANNGYFYCSFFDAGILSENAVFPTFKNIPNPSNIPHVYSHDELGWVDNYGFGSNHSYALAKHTIMPTMGSLLPQKIMRVGTYAVDSNTNISIKLYQSFNGISLSRLIDQENLNSIKYPGFYTVDFNLKADTMQTDIYVMVEYTSNPNCISPIPIEKLEVGHTSNNFIASSGSCWISQNGNSWQQTGAGTTLMFDPCIKLYTQSSIIAKLNADIGSQACVGTVVNLTNTSVGIEDSSVWIINGYLYWNMPILQYTLSSPGTTNIDLIVYYGDHIDTASYLIIVHDYPDVNVTKYNNTLNAVNTTGAFYQWLDCDNNYSIINGEINQLFTPLYSGNYAVEINDNGCIDTSLCTSVIVSIKENEFKNKILVYPNPTKDFVEITVDEDFEELNIVLRNILGQKIMTKKFINTKTIKLDLPIEKGIYLLEIKNKENEKVILRIVKE